MRRALLVLVLSVAFVGACGGGDDDNDNAADPSSESDSNGDAAGAFTASRCADEARRLGEASAGVAQAVTGGGQSLKASADALEAAADAAPSEIRADFQVVAEGYGKIAEALAEANFDPSSGQPPSESDLQAFQEASAEVDTDEFRAASERVSTWFAEECGQ